MKKKSLIFKEQRNAVWKKIVALRSKSETAETEITEAELLEIRTLEKEYDAFADTILDAEKNEARAAEMVAEEIAIEQRATAAANQSNSDRRGGRDNRTPEERSMSDFSFIKAIRSAKQGGQLTGVELEMFQEAQKEARASGFEVEGNIAVPSFFVEKRANLTAGTAATAGNLIQTDLGSVIDALRPNLIAEQMGVQMLNGLVGNLKKPRQNGVTTAAWAAENATAATSNPTFEVFTMSPKRLTAVTYVSDTLMRQTALSMEAMVRRELALARDTKLDATIINGSGTGNEPIGILNIAGIGSVVGDTNGAAPTWENIVALNAAVASNNANMGSLGYLINPATKAKLQTTKKDAGSGIFIMGEINDQLAGYRAGVTTQVPSNLTKGTGTGLSAIIYANFNSFLLGTWGGMSILVNPYTSAKEAMTEVVVHSYHDTNYEHAESFAAMVDAITT